MTISIPLGPVADGVAEEYDWDAEPGFSLESELPEWRLVVAPARGIFHAPAPNGAPTAVTSQNAGGTELGHIEARHDQQPIIAPWPGAVIEWLVQDGDPVGAGQPVARLLPFDAALDAETSVASGTAIDVA